MKAKYFKLIIFVLLVLLVSVAVCSCGAKDSSTPEIREIIDGLEENQIIVSFPGLGIEPFVINKNIFAIPLGVGNTLHILSVLGAVCAIAYAFFRAKHSEKIKPGDFFDIAIWGLMIGIIGGRLLYVLCSLDKYKDVWSAFNLWDGGSSIFGGLIFGGIAVFVICKMQKLSFLKVADMAASGVLLGQIVGRLDNFFCGESYGYSIGKGELFEFLRMGIYPHANKDVGKNLDYVHPTFLYEMVWNIIGFVIINLLYRKKKFDGQIFYFYTAWYGFGRMFIEMLRVDSLHVGSLRISMIIACLCFVFGVMLLILGTERGKKERAAKESYEKVYTNFNTGNPLTAKYSEEKEEKEEKEEPEPEEEEENEDN